MILTKRLFALTLLAALSISATANSQTTEFEIKATIDDLENALNDSNIIELNDIYSDKAMVIPAEKDALNDKPAITAFWNNRLNDGKSHFKIDVIDLQVKNNIAYLSALWSATVIKDGTSPEILDGYMSNVLERQSDGNWKIRVQNWN